MAIDRNEMKKNFDLRRIKTSQVFFLRPEIRRKLHPRESIRGVKNSYTGTQAKNSKRLKNCSNVEYIMKPNIRDDKLMLITLLWRSRTQEANSTIVKLRWAIATFSIESRHNFLSAENTLRQRCERSLFHGLFFYRVTCANVRVSEPTIICGYSRETRTPGHLGEKKAKKKSCDAGKILYSLFWWDPSELSPFLPKTWLLLLWRFFFYLYTHLSFINDKTTNEK